MGTKWKIGTDECFLECRDLSGGARNVMSYRLVGFTMRQHQLPKRTFWQGFSKFFIFISEFDND